MNAQCTVFNHIAQCACLEGYSGDPFSQCVIMPERDGEYFVYFLNIFL